MDCRLYLPENNTLRHVIIAISENMKIVDRDGNEMDKPFGHNRDKLWRNLTQRRCHFFFFYLGVVRLGWGLGLCQNTLTPARTLMLHTLIENVTHCL